jgi:hypothetical protein
MDDNGRRMIVSQHISQRKLGNFFLSWLVAYLQSTK